jgi:hypothetical protein
MSGLINHLGRTVLPYQNTRIVAPPGRLTPGDRPALVVATPMRSGTHILIDLLLNNLPAYRRQPLYADLDQFCRHARRTEAVTVAPADFRGYVVKTHYPTGINETPEDAALVSSVAREAIVLTVDRPLEEIKASLERWVAEAPCGGSTRPQRHVDEIEARLPQFRAFWRERAHIALQFRDLFDAAQMTVAMDRIATLTGAARRPVYAPPPKPAQLTRIHIDKTLTRLLGAGAPRINTTIHTLKRRR